MRDQPTPEQTPERIAKLVERLDRLALRAFGAHGNDAELYNGIRDSKTELAAIGDALTATLAHLTQERDELRAELTCCIDAQVVANHERTRAEQAEATLDHLTQERDHWKERTRLCSATVERLEAALARVKAPSEAVALIEAERSRQDQLWPRDGHPLMPQYAFVAPHLLLLDHYVRRTMDRWKDSEAETELREEIVKIAAIAVRALEEVKWDAALVDPPVSPKESKMDKRARGLYKKFVVTRTDGQSEPGQKHDGCNYFVLDLTHDPHAIPALRAYAESCRADYPLLAHDLDALAVDPPVSSSTEQTTNPENRPEQD